VHVEAAGGGDGLALLEGLAVDDRLVRVLVDDPLALLGAGAAGAPGLLALEPDDVADVDRATSW
jgi:hypothetical protein